MKENIKEKNQKYENLIQENSKFSKESFKIKDEIN